MRRNEEREEGTKDSLTGMSDGTLADAAASAVHAATLPRVTNKSSRKIILQRTEKKKKTTTESLFVLV